MRYWSLWDQQLLRALRSEFEAVSPALTFQPGEEGGIAVWTGDRRLGHWVASGRQEFSFIANPGVVRSATNVGMLDIISANYELFADLLPGAASVETAPEDNVLRPKQWAVSSDKDEAARLA